MHIPPLEPAGLRILQNLPFLATNIIQKDRQGWEACFCCLWNNQAGWKYVITAHVANNKDNKLYFSLVLKAFVVDRVS